MESILAIDLGKFKSVACIYCTEENSYKFETFKTNKQNIHDLVLKHDPDCVVIEICSIAGWVHDLVSQMDVEIKVANTNDQRWRWNMIKNKTDRNDALRLAKLTYLGELPQVHLPQAKIRQKRSLINYRKSLSERITQVKNSIRAILDSQAIEMEPGKKGWSKRSKMQLKQLARPFGQADIQQIWRSQLWMEIELLEGLIDALETVEQQLDGLNAVDKNVQILQSISGVGPRLAEATAAYLDETGRFSNGKEVGCYVGLTPRQYQSGTMDRQGRISGQGNKLLRSLLVEVSWLALRWNRWAREIYERVRRGCPTRKKIAIVAVARKLLVRMWAMMRDGTRWQPGQIKSSI